MPIYEYECAACRVRFDRQQSVHDAPVKECPECGGSTRRIFHPVGIIFKGSGFYVTDNRRPSPSGSATSPTSKEGTESAASTAKSEATDSSTTKVAEKVPAKTGSD